MKIARRAISGVLLLDKHAGLSSNTAVGWSKRLLNAEKAGHTGTLDPFATGLLPLCFGEAAKFARFMLDAEKAYRATLKLGQKSSTGDTEGQIVETRPVDVDINKVNVVLARFAGTQTQIPPMHSALKQGGVPLYKLARQGLEVERAPREINVTKLRAVSLEGDELVIDTVVTKGTYIRVLAEDIGEALGCGAHLTALRRTATGGFGLEQAVTLETLDGMDIVQRDAKLLPADSLAMALPEIHLDAITAKALQNGQTPRIASLSMPLRDTENYRAYGVQGAFLGVATASQCDAENATLTALRMMAPSLVHNAENP
ncbi:MAG: tRNA pseudouridine(55) synthase TruB [Burkholderiales bacterium]|nr:tRNA pseudouridine(55) synthase TruB [Burkholderiales bacterium]